MCGIAGAIAREPSRRVNRVSCDLTRALAHRGPDGEGFWSLAADGRPISGAGVNESAIIALGHRRLSIVDLANGQQPMANEDGSVIVSFNGEIYNFAELRALLERQGHRFRTNADTEVLVHGWEEWGTELFGRLNGIFAFALADVSKRSVVLARDPLGVKPLFVGTSEGITWWCSELGPAVEAGLTGSRIAPDALRLFLTLRFIPSPTTIYEGATKLPPGHYTVISAERANEPPTYQRFRPHLRSTAEPRDRNEWREALGFELKNAVRRQMMSDVPVGSLLSGGVDSSVITTLMRETSATSPQAFAIGFKDGGVASETAAASLVAAELGVPLTAVDVTRDEYLEAWPSALAKVDEPVGNPGQLLVGVLCQTVRRTHKVVLSGQGADEPLGGYPRHMAERLWRIGRLTPRVSAWGARQLLGDDAGARLTRVLRQTERIDRFVDILAVMSPEDVDSLMRTGGSSPTARELTRAALLRWSDEAADDDSLNGLLKVDARLSLADDLLTIADHFSMRASVELRVPFLDLSLVELAERMPSRYKISAFGERKWLYRSTARGLLPPVTARRLCGLGARLGRKEGFSTPAGLWSELVEQRGPVAEFIDWQKVQARQATFSVRQRVAFASLTAWGARAA